MLILRRWESFGVGGGAWGRRARQNQMRHKSNRKLRYNFRLENQTQPILGSKYMYVWELEQDSEDLILYGQTGFIILQT